MNGGTPTRSAYLALREERQGMHEGYRFLDEKRLALAAGMISQLGSYQALEHQLRVAYAEAIRSLRGAVARHGLTGLYHYPPLPGPEQPLTCRQESLLGVVQLQTPEVWSNQVADERPAINASPEAERCRSDFARLLPLLAKLAVLAGNLLRLRDEYRRTARRARALEDVLLPELDEQLRFLDGALEEQEREEAIRARHCGGGQPV
jgi:V/A-type H+-transporting ATPase subunit D